MMLTINTTNIIENENFLNFIEEYIKPYIGNTISVTTINSITHNINNFFIYYIEKNMSNKIYIVDNCLLIVVNNPLLDDLDFLYKNEQSNHVYFYNILKYYLTDEEVFYLKLKYNAIDGCYDITKENFFIEVLYENCD